MKDNVLLRYVFFLLGMFSFSFQSMAQNLQISAISEMKPVYVKSISKGDMANTIYLRTDFAEAGITNPSVMKRVKGRVITGIDLVYSNCRESQTFDQKKLNEDRLLMLNWVDPKLLSDPVIEWKLIAQTDCGSTDGGHNMFHGFVIHMRPLMTKEEREKEISEMDDLLKKLASGKDIAPVKPHPKKEGKPAKRTGVEETIPDLKRSYKYYSWDSLCVSTTFYGTLDKVPTFFSGDIKIPEYLNNKVKIPKKKTLSGDTGMVQVQFTIMGSGEVTDVNVTSEVNKDVQSVITKAFSDMPRWNPAILKGRKITMKGSMGLFIHKSGWISCCANSATVYGITLSSPVPNGFIYDSTIFKVFNRNPEWDNMLVVCDFTGSMFPYTSQLLVWHKLNFNANKDRVKHYTFFNDGDLKPDHAKKVGKTGGIYHSKATTFEEVAELAQKTMNGGGGGDCPENNLEATLEGMQKCPECTDIVMIADNYATPRDLSLYYKLNKPIHVILCGSFGGANVAYLNLVKKVGGSIHTMEQDIVDLTKMNEGETIEISGVLYRVTGGKFQMVKRI